MEELFGNVARTMDREDIGRIASTLNTISNDKMRQEKADQRKGKKSKKPQILTGKSASDTKTRAQPSYMDDYDDLYVSTPVSLFQSIRTVTVYTSKLI